MIDRIIPILPDSKYHVVLSSGGYYIVRYPDKYSDVVVFTGTYQACLHYIDPINY